MRLLWVKSWRRWLIPSSITWYLRAGKRRVSFLWSHSHLGSRMRTTELPSWPIGLTRARLKCSGSQVSSSPRHSWREPCKTSQERTRSPSIAFHSHTTYRMTAHSRISRRSQRMAATSMVCTWKAASTATTLTSWRIRTLRSYSWTYLSFFCCHSKIERFPRPAYIIARSTRCCPGPARSPRRVTRPTTSCWWSSLAIKHKINGSRLESQSSSHLDIEQLP